MNFDKKSLSLQYITDETGNKMAVVLPINQLEGLLNQLAELAKAAESRQATPSMVENKPVAVAEYSKVDQEILLIKEQYERLNGLFNELQKYKDLQTELDRKLFFQRLTTSLETDLQGMRTQLGELKKCTKPAPLYQVPESPKNLILPTPLFSELKAKLLAEASDGQKPPLLIEAPSGTGKSSLAIALARDEEIRRIFPDGIFWIEFSKEPPLIGDQINSVIRTLDNAEVSFVDLEEASEHLRKLCVTRACLTILDDVWDAQDILSFNVSSEHSQLLITTSDPNLLNITQYFIKNIKNYELKTLPEKSAVDYFWRCVGKTSSIPAVLLNDLVSTCSYLPEAIKLVANLAQTQPAATLLEQLRDQTDDFSERHPRSLMQALHLNVQALGEQADYYLSLAVFANYTHIPQNPVLMLWRYLYQMLDDQANNFIKDLVDKSLLEVKEQSSQRYLSLHSYQHDYLRGEAELEKLHSHLLAAYRRQCAQHGWLSGPNDGYFFENLAKHLVQAGRKNELKLLLLDFDWMQKKLQITNVYSLVHDYELLEDRDVEVIKKALYEAVPILMNYKAELAVQLLDRLWGEKNLQNNKDIQGLLNQAKETSPQWRWQPHFEEEEMKKKVK